MHVIGLPEGKERERKRKAICEATMTRISPKLKKDANPQM